jgi:hypothetical protein
MADFEEIRRKKAPTLQKRKPGTKKTRFSFNKLLIWWETEFNPK